MPDKGSGTWRVLREETRIIRDGNGLIIGMMDESHLSRQVVDSVNSNSLLITTMADLKTVNVQLYRWVLRAKTAIRTVLDFRERQPDDLVQLCETLNKENPEVPTEPNVIEKLEILDRIVEIVGKFRGGPPAEDTPQQLVYEHNLFRNIVGLIPEALTCPSSQKAKTSSEA